MAYSTGHNPNNANDTPAYNDSIFKFWNWFDNVWSCNDWVTWHKANVAQYNLATANNKFLEHWDNLATASSAIDCRSFNTAFRDYMRKAGLLNTLYSGIGIIAKPIGTVADIGTNVLDTASGTTRVLKIIVPLLLIAVVLFLVMKYQKQLK